MYIPNLLRNLYLYSTSSWFEGTEKLEARLGFFGDRVMKSL
jgi:hypothetical protein